jgi:hypothetical protein
MKGPTPDLGYTHAVGIKSLWVIEAFSATAKTGPAPMTAATRAISKFQDRFAEGLSLEELHYKQYQFCPRKKW